MRRTRVAALLGTVAGALLLSGCAAGDLPLAGVRVGADGAPYALIRPCGNDSYQGLALDGRPGGVDEGPVTSGWDAEGERSGDAGFPLFSPPDAWRARHRGAQHLVAGHSYRLAFGHYITGDAYNGIADFSAEDIARLRPGQVWADGRAMSLRAFERLAEDAC